MKLLLLGNYGVDNIGDDALLAYFLSHYSYVCWMVVTAKPVSSSDLPRLPGGIRSIWTPWFRTIRALYRCDGIVYGGGTLFTDSESMLACFLWSSYAFFAWIFRKRIYLAFQGVGPFCTRIGFFLSKFVFCHAEYISVRDQASRLCVENFIADSPRKNKKIVQTFDPVFTLLNNQNDSLSAKNLIIIPRYNSSELFFQRAVALLHSQSWDSIKVLFLQHKSEQYAISRFQCLASIHDKVDICFLSRYQDLLTHVSNASFVLTQRYHGAIAALSFSVPFETVPLMKSDKLSSLRLEERALYARFVRNGEDTLHLALKSID